MDLAFKIGIPKQQNKPFHGENKCPFTTRIRVLKQLK